MSSTSEPSVQREILHTHKRLLVVLIVGPTAVGKTSFAIELAKHLRGEIISMDSRTFYRGMDIGTAKPTPSERAQVPHHLVDVIDPDQTWPLAEVQREVQKLVIEIQGRNRLPLLVGGSGQYVRAFHQGWQTPPVAPNPQLRRELERWAQEIGKDGLHARLFTLDAQAARTIDFRNLRRTIRALEVIFSTGKPFSQQRALTASPFRTCIIGLTMPREELYRRIDQRIEAMFAQGWVEEVRRLLAKGYTCDLPSFSAIGYREVANYIQGKLTLEEAKQLIRRKTRTFVRRQANWFKPEDPDIHWFMMQPDTLAQVEAFLRAWLEQSESIV